MFEKDTRRVTREKSHLEHPKSPKRDKKKDEDPKTVYGELKLSEKLSLEIVQLRKEKEQMKEEIEYLKVKSLEHDRKQ